MQRPGFYISFVIMAKKKGKQFVFTAESLKKKFRWSEFLAEKIISSVAFLSIAIIILIFFFVFRESFGIFNFKDTAHAATGTELVTENTNSSGQETYGAPEEYQQETYGDVVDSSTMSTSGGEVLEAAPENENRSAIRTLGDKDWLPVSDRPRYGLLPLLVGTIKLTLIAVLIAAPLAILAALYSSTFAPKWARETIKPAIELLAGIPSVVIGFFALMVMATLFQDLFGYSTRLNSFVGGVALALAAIPIIYTITEDALNAIPKSYTEASLALGATKWQTAIKVVLPAATPGIFAAVLLGTGRVFGETMIALMATGNAALVSANPFDSVRTLSATIGAEMAEVVFGDTHYSVLFLIGALLFIFTFLINAIAEFYIKGKLMKRIQGR